MKNCGFSYAICGGYALEIFLGKELRSHSDVDLSVFEEDRANIVKFLLEKGWNIYERLHGSTSGQLRNIPSPDDEKLAKLPVVWAIKPGNPKFKLEASPPNFAYENIYNYYDYEIIGDEQTEFDFIEIFFNKKKDGEFLFWPFFFQDKEHEELVTRSLGKAILYSDEGIPYLAPEVIQFITAHPAYMDSDYHKTKNHIDFEAVIPFLPKESKNWLINALKTAYPNGHKRIKTCVNSPSKSNFE